MTKPRLDIPTTFGNGEKEREALRRFCRDSYGFSVCPEHGISAVLRKVGRRVRLLDDATGRPYYHTIEGLVVWCYLDWAQANEEAAFEFGDGSKARRWEVL